jgi:hypothetical protein
MYTYEQKKMLDVARTIYSVSLISIAAVALINSLSFIPYAKGKVSPILVICAQLI